MICFKTLTLKNFLSYGNNITSINFSNSGTTLIVGENIDNSSEDGSNGCGKTTIINALTYALYDKTISDISKDGLINNINKKNLEVTIEFEKNNNKYFIKRVRKSKQGNYVVFKINDKDVTLDSINNTNRLIEKHIGFPYELFVRIIVFSATNEAFLSLPTKGQNGKANQTDIIEELFNIKSITDKAMMLKSIIKDTENTIKTDLIKIESLEREHERHNTQIASFEKRITEHDKSNTQKIDNLKHSLDTIKNIDIEVEQQLFVVIEELSDDINEVNQRIIIKEKQYVELDKTKSTLSLELNKNNNNKNKLQKALLNFDKKINNCEHELKHLNDEKCPYCLQQFISNEKIDNINDDIVNFITNKQESEIELKNIDLQYSDIEQQIKTIDIQIDGINDELDVLVTEKRKLTKKKASIISQLSVKNKDELYNLKSKIDTIQQQIIDKESSTNPFIDPLNELKNNVIDEIDYTKLNNDNKRLEHQKILLKLLTRKDSFVRKTLLDKYIPYLNSRMDYYLKELGLQHKVEFTHELKTNIYLQFGREMSFGNLSSGQQARVNLALSFAFRDVLMKSNEKINIILLDEILDVALDQNGVQKAAKMLKSYSRNENTSVYIISHRDEIDNSFENVMKIQMNKNFSFIA